MQAIRECCNLLHPGKGMATLRLTEASERECNRFKLKTEPRTENQQITLSEDRVRGVILSRRIFANQRERDRCASITHRRSQKLVSLTSAR